MKKTFIIIMIIVISCTCVVNACAERNTAYGEFYPRLSIVVETQGDKVICEDKDGNQWIFFAEESTWECGDICNLLMWNCSEDITRHEVIEIYWEGYTEDIALWIQIALWTQMAARR